MIKLVFIRTDASQKIGYGHVMRSMSLAEKLRNSGVIVEFITRNHLGNINEIIKNNGFTLHLLPLKKKIIKQQGLNKYEQWLGVKQEVDARETIQVLRDRKADWLIVDHYALNEIWESKLKPYTKKIMVIDDLLNRKHDCDLLLNQNYINDNTCYDNLISPNTMKLLGPKYALLRKDFVKYRKEKLRNHDKINRVFLFFGGSDLDNLTSVSLKALSRPKLKHLIVDVVIGDANPHKAKLKKEIDKCTNINLYVQIQNMAELMAKADIFLGAGGSITWERMSLGLPGAVVTTANNQVSSTKCLDQDGYLKWIGGINQVDESKIYHTVLDLISKPSKLEKQSSDCLKLVEGKGVDIVSRLLMTGPHTKSLVVRRATKSDLLLYWYWANEIEVRQNAFNQEPIKLEEHKKWFSKKLNDNNAILLLVESYSNPIGQVRFDRMGSSHYTISYSLAKQYRGFSLGKEILKKSINYLKKDQLFTLIAKVKDSNHASKKVFKNLGFTEFKNHKNSSISNFELQFTPNIHN